MSSSDANTAQEVATLRVTIRDIDSLSQCELAKVAAIAQLALAYLETPEAYQHPDRIAYALQAIRDTAMDAENCINAMAEDAGCNHVGEREARRYQAWDVARQTA